MVKCPFSHISLVWSKTREGKRRGRRNKEEEKEKSRQWCSAQDEKQVAPIDELGGDQAAHRYASFLFFHLFFFHLNASIHRDYFFILFILSTYVAAVVPIDEKLTSK